MDVTAAGTAVEPANGVGRVTTELGPYPGTGMYGLIAPQWVTYQQTEAMPNMPACSSDQTSYAAVEANPMLLSNRGLGWGGDVQGKHVVGHV